MLRRIIADPRLPVILFRIDCDLAREVKAKGCPFCKGRLHSARYPRKVRCEKDLPQSWDLRFSFCCAEEGCRKRTTPPSVRFFGRRLYPAAVVVLLCALSQGAPPRRLSVLRSALGVDRRTVARWRKWWIETFPETGFFKKVRDRFLPPLDRNALPLSLLLRFGKIALEGLVSLLRFLTDQFPNAPPDRNR